MPIQKALRLRFAPLKLPLSRKLRFIFKKVSEFYVKFDVGVVEAVGSSPVTQTILSVHKGFDL